MAQLISERMILEFAPFCLPKYCMFILSTDMGFECTKGIFLCLLGRWIFCQVSMFAWMLDKVLIGQQEVWREEYEGGSISLTKSFNFCDVGCKTFFLVSTSMRIFCYILYTCTVLFHALHLFCKNVAVLWSLRQYLVSSDESNQLKITKQSLHIFWKDFCFKKNHSFHSDLNIF